MTKQTFIQGTVILVLAGLLTRILGFINKMVVARIMGPEGVGLYMMATPTLILLITLTQFGLPVAISKLVAEAETTGDEARVKRILVVSIAITASLSVIFTVGMMLAIPFLSNYLLTDERAIYPLLATIPIVPIVALSAILRGYFQGKQNMRPTAMSQVIEQLVRITLVAICTKALLPFGIEYAAAGAMISVVMGELVSLLYMIWQFKKQQSFRVRRRSFTALKSGKRDFSDLMQVALPTTGSRMIGSLSYFFEPIVVAHSLAAAGVATAVATSQYGALNGFALPLLFLPTFITHALSISLVPAVSEAWSNQNFELIHRRLSQSIRTATIFGGASVAILFIFAEPLMDLLYEAPEAAIYVQLIAPFSLFLYFQGPLQSVLQALNLARTAMINSLIGASIKLLLIAILASQPNLGMTGTAIAISFSMVLVTLLHAQAIAKTLSLVFRFRPIVSWVVVIGATMWISAQAKEVFSFLDSVFLITTAGILFSLLSYLLLMFSFRLVNFKDLRHFRVLFTMFKK
ncbi:stage V sporulation protein B [Salsuginibacillus kocurii]|uniref:stage V sporulation protein B n=1 Tax=Salsuginibacillus kocurii TaxID=427078 RepID=UPI00036E2320|nr:stage V sporulation protein B [Salsuginibacillus kocurii]